MPKTYKVFIVQAYERQLSDLTVGNNCVLELICDSEKEAFKKAKSLIKKKHYRIMRVIEKFNAST